ncbi:MULTISPECIES: aspartate kinase [Duncaniella]|jgi:aspartate kinase|uniref:Aspartokinase n=6 Tax=Duncaniella TaxID=2518495 RepID=A0A2V1IMQ1_9BACT|nr:MULTISPECIES: aspartate kinase [Duncaniella]NBH92118.1 aspartate kinase [Muribaculaceae bacterium S4]NBI20601.1 aspartate kinase [Muribaculaceae bacterium Z1]ROS91709.1 aspartate kinase [Muribaculaceae bacterium Isolate-039 (Harlan)]ROS96399.1 aspartate kinase [Muribaculaceae bacterium Isolate-077 (Janvier)]ROS97605.1 aspartate kinase [Muribaculaceae bacterium Isolate-083 (Janvier)]ROT00056.1 aspartate kinase [Muribaculaceae bacterium Isolate-084 (Janvier)]GFI52472.1 lysine-sensitive aspa
MKVLKFGGTSVGSAERIRHVADLVSARGKNIIVLSAMSGTTNSLVEISDYLYKKNTNGAKETINLLESKYLKTIASLYDRHESREKALKEIKACFNYIRSFTQRETFGPTEEKIILAQGEIMSVAMMTILLNERGLYAEALPALDFMKTGQNGEPDMQHIALHLQPLLDKYVDADIFVTQGFICRNSTGEIDNLQRGGSDYTASLIGAAIEADEIEIWTDIDGMHNNDPRFVEGTKPVNELHYEEASELAYFGAKILHPTCVLPAKVNNIPVRLLNTLEPEAHGTLIYNNITEPSIKAVAAKDNVVAIKIKSSRMLLAYGYLTRVFETFEKYRTPIDMIATSEVGVSLTIDSERFLPEIIDELKKFGTVTVDKDMVIICVVGNMEWTNTGYEAKAMEALADIPVRMISYGGSNYNISFLVRSCDKVEALKRLSEKLFS